MSANPHLKFEVIAVTHSSTTQDMGLPQLLNKMSGCSGLWKEFAHVETSAKSVFESSTNTKLSLTDLVPEATKEADWRGFQCILDFDEARISAERDIRIELMEGLQRERFNEIFVTQDDFSEQVATSLYPYLFKVENALRRYLTKFYTINQGPNYISGVIKDKKNEVTSRIKEWGQWSSLLKETGHIFAYDFDKLGELLYSTEPQKMQNLESKVLSLEPSNTQEIAGALEELQSALTSDFARYFQTHFKSTDFKSKWESLSRVRNRIAHTGLFSYSDREDFISESDVILTDIENAYADLDNLKITDEIIEKLEASIKQPAAETQTGATEIKDVIQKFIKQEYDDSAARGRFIALSLARSKMIDRYSQFEEFEIGRALAELISEGHLVKYHVSNPRNPEHPVSAIRPADSKPDLINQIQ